MLHRIGHLLGWVTWLHPKVSTKAARRSSNPGKVRGAGDDRRKHSLFRNRWTEHAATTTGKAVNLQRTSGHMRCSSKGDDLSLRGGHHAVSCSSRITKLEGKLDANIDEDLKTQGQSLDSKPRRGVPPPKMLQSHLEERWTDVVAEACERLTRRLGAVLKQVGQDFQMGIFNLLRVSDVCQDKHTHFLSGERTTSTQGQSSLRSMSSSFRKPHVFLTEISSCFVTAWLIPRMGSGGL